MWITKNTPLRSLVKNEILSNRSVNGLATCQVHTVGDLIERFDSAEALLNVPKLGRKSSGEIATLIDAIKEKIPNQESELRFWFDDGDSPEPQEEEEEVVVSAVSTVANSFLQRVYDDMYHDLQPVRLMNYCERYLSDYHKIVPFFDLAIHEYTSKAPHHYISKHLDAFYNFVQIFREKFYEYSQMDEHQILLPTLKYDYPFMTYEQLLLMTRHVETYGFKPMFLILYQYMILSKDNKNMMYCKRYGLVDGKKHLLKELAQEYQLTSERVRQIVLGNLEVHKADLMSDEDWRKEDVLDLPYLTEDMPAFKRCKEREGLNLSFDIFARLLEIAGRYTVALVNGVQVAYDGNKCDLNTLDIGGPQEDSERRIKVGDKLCRILEENGRPLSLDEIQRLFVGKYPEHKVLASDSMRRYLNTHPKIKAIGKSSTYGLVDWTNVYYGSKIDLLYDILNTAEEPLQIEDILTRVKEHYPNTSKNSIATTMQSDPQSRFVQFAKNYYGLRTKLDNYQGEFNVLNDERRRFSFEEKLQEYKHYVEVHHERPRYNTNAILTRWFYNQKRDYAQFPESKKKSFEDLLSFLASIEKN